MDDIDGHVFEPGDECLVVWADGSIYAGVVEKRYDPQEDVVFTRKRDKSIQAVPTKNDSSWKARHTIDSAEGIEYGEMLWYRVHYRGWKRQYDDWVPQRRMLVMNSLNLELQKSVNFEKQAARPESGGAPGAASSKRKRDKTNGTSNGSTKRRKGEPKSATSGSEDTKHGGKPSNTVTSAGSSSGSGKSAGSTGTKEAEVRVAVPLDLKRILIDDWEYVTKDRRIINLPRPYNVEDILGEYRAYCTPRLVTDGANENMDSFISGLLTYFDRCLGMLLLYRFERQQYFEFRQQTKPTPDDFKPYEVYGAEHLSRLLISMPALLAQAAMDEKTLDYMVNELSELGRFLAVNKKFFGGPEAYDVGTRLYEECAN